MARVGGPLTRPRVLRLNAVIDQRMARGIIEGLLEAPVLVEDDALREALDTARVVLAASWAGPRAAT